MLRGFVIFVSGNLNPRGTFMYISLFMHSYKHVMTTSSHFEIVKLIKNQNVIAFMHDRKECFLIVNTISLL